ncbi:glycosyltransferase [Herbiconiux sp. SYSU D00978]|uniref:glycosyltransferase n=1 Tax=Herbiconiux sp. SYSU D00978 TaxID=2812562 RepID=UPI001A95C9F6|nr:glycosyltransferase [Herbiconiux sp. SYSU D00978]
MGSYLLASTPVHGHVTPVLSVARHLVSEGHRVRLLTGIRYRDAVASTGAEFLRLPAEADYDDRDLDAAFPGRARLSGIDRMRFDAEAIFLAPVRAQLAAVDAALAAEHTDAVLAETMFVAAAALALRPRAERPAVVNLGVTPLPLPSVDTAPFGLGFAPMAGPVGRLRDRTLAWAADRVVFAHLERRAREVMGDLEGRPLPANAFEAAGLVDAIVQLTVPGFEYPRRDLPETVHFVGPLRRTQPLAAELPEWWGDLATARRVVHVTQGTVANTDFDELVRPTLQALAAEDVLVVVSTGGRPVEELGPVPANARVARFIPHDALLPYVDVMVTNGGYGGVHEALGRGIPLVAVGVSEDKPEVVARVKWSGAGIGMRTARPSARALRRAVRRLLAEDSFARRAAALGAEIAAAPGASGVEAVLASVAVGTRETVGAVTPLG